MGWFVFDFKIAVFPGSKAAFQFHHWISSTGKFHAGARGQVADLQP
jgi:hypothetical protein